MSGIFLSDFLFISTHISLYLLSLGSAKAHIGWGEKLNNHLLASCVRNIFTKNDQNLVIGFEVTVKNVWDVFLRHSDIFINFINYSAKSRPSKCNETRI